MAPHEEIENTPDPVGFEPTDDLQNRSPLLYQLGATRPDGSWLWSIKMEISG